MADDALQLPVAEPPASDSVQLPSAPPVHDDGFDPSNAVPAAEPVHSDGFDPNNAVPTHADGFDPDNAVPTDQYLQQQAIGAINAHRAGSVNLSEDELMKANLLAQDGHWAIKRAIDKAMAIPGQMLDALPSISGGKMSTGPIVDSIGKALTDEYARQEDESKKPVLSQLASGLADPYRYMVAGVGGIAKQIAPTVETAYSAAHVLDPMTTMLDIADPQGQQYQDALTQTGIDQATRVGNVGTAAVEKALGVDPQTSLGTKLAEQAAPLAAFGAIPGGELEGLTEGVSDLSSNVVSGARKGIAYADKAMAQTAPIQVGVVKVAGGAALGGLAGGPLGAGLVGKFVGGLAGFMGGNASKADAIVKAFTGMTREQVVESANAIIGADKDVNAGEAIFNQAKAPIEEQLSTLQHQIVDSRIGLNDDDLIKLNKINPDNGKPLYPPEDFSGAAKKVREKEVQSQQLQSNLDTLQDAFNKRAKVNQFFSDAANYTANMTANMGLAAGAGAGFAGGSTPPEDTSQMGTGALFGLALSLGPLGAHFATKQGMLGNWLSKNSDALISLGEKNQITPDHPLYQENQKGMSSISPDAQDMIMKNQGLMANSGQKIVVLTPEDFAKNEKIVQGQAAPNGRYDSVTKTAYINANALGTGVVGHEVGHAIEQAHAAALKDYGVALDGLMKNQYPAVDDRFQQAVDSYRNAMLQSIPHTTSDQGFVFQGSPMSELSRLNPQTKEIETVTQKGSGVPNSELSDKQLRSEITASLAADLFRQYPPEMLYGGGGKGLIGKWVAGLKAPDITSTSLAGFPVTKEMQESLKSALFQVGEKAAEKPKTIAPDMQNTASAVQSVSDILKGVKTAEPSENAATEAPANPSNVQVNVPDAVEAVVATGISKKNATDRVNAAIQDLQGKDYTLEDVVKGALQRSIPIPTEGQPVAPPESKQSLSSATTDTGEPQSQAINPVQHGEFEQPGYTATSPNLGEAGLTGKVTPESLKSVADQAEQDLRIAGFGKKGEKRIADEVDKARLEAMAKHHAAANPNSDLITYRTDKFGKGYIGGKTLDPNDPFHQELMRRAGLSTNDEAKISELSDKMGQTVGIDYLHAPEEQSPSGETRKPEQEASTASERVAGESAQRRMSKTFVPNGITFNRPSNTFEVNGFSPDKFYNNAANLIPWLKSKGIRAYDSVNDPNLTQDYHNYVTLHDNNYSINGKPIIGTERTSVGKPTEGFDPKLHEIPKDRADVLNALMGNESARTGNKLTDRQAEKQSLAQVNSPYFDRASGETNRIRAMMDKDPEMGRGKLESTSETLRPELIDKIREPDVPDEQTLRPSGFTGDRSELAAKGTPRSEHVAAGYMPFSSHAEDRLPSIRKMKDEVLGGINANVPEKLKDVTKQNGLIYNGVMNDKSGEPKLQMFSDPVAKTTFSVRMDATGAELQDKLQSVRDRFKNRLDNSRFMPAISDIGFYSKLEQVAEDKIPNKASAEQILATLKSNGVKPDEMKWTGLDDFLKSNPNPTKDQLLTHIRENNVQIKEVMKGQGEISHDLKTFIGHPNETPSTPEKWESLSNRIERIAQKWQTNGDDEQAQKYFLMSEEAGQHASGVNPETGSTSGMTKFEQHVLPGGELGSYRELLLTLPPKKGLPPIVEKGPMGQWQVTYPDGNFEGGYTEEEARLAAIAFNRSSEHADAPTFQSSHFDEPNILAHVRFNDRTDADGKKTLFIEELQSDMHQKGRREGYKVDQAQLDKWAKEINDLTVISSNRSGSVSAKEQSAALQRESEISDLWNRHNDGVPDAPFKTTWPNLAFKRVLRMAAEKGYDSVSWTTGDQQAERYDLSKSVDKITASKEGDQFHVNAMPKGGTGANDMIRQTVPASKLADTIGKDLADKVATQKEGEWQTYEGQDLKVGGSGMRSFYDKILPSVANDIGKKFGAKVGTTRIDSDPNVTDEGYRVQGREGESIDDAMKRQRNEAKAGLEVHSLDITPQMKESVMQGQPLFMPSTNPLAVKEAAIRTPDGAIHTDSGSAKWHGGAWADMVSKYSGSQLGSWIKDHGDNYAEYGFVTNNGEFLDRKEALKRAQEYKQITPEGVASMQAGQKKTGTKTGGLEALSLPLNIKLKKTLSDSSL